MKILLADDTEINRLYLGEALSGLGAQVQTCVDGHAALEQANAHHFDLLVLDIRMPRLYGDEVLRLLRQSTDAASRHSPAVAVSSEMDAELAERLLAEGFVAALLKPVQATAVLAAAGMAVPAGGLARSAPHMPDSQPPAQLDDVQAVRALGSMPVVLRLRGMLAQELRVRMPELEAMVVARQDSQVRDWIHQMRASCALCGALRLDQLLLELRAQVLLFDWVAACVVLQQIRAETVQLYPLLEASDAPVSSAR